MKFLFFTILEFSLQATVFILAVILIRFLLQSQTRKFAYCLWLLVFVKLATGFSMQVSIPSFFEAQPTVQSTQQSVLEGTDRLLNPQLYHSFIQAFPQQQHENLPENSTPNQDFQSQSFALLTKENAINFVCGIWMIGVSLLVIRFIFQIIMIQKTVRFSILIKENIYQNELLASPFVFGFIRPKIYLPAGWNVVTSQGVIAHEQAHIKRLDYLVKPMVFLVCAIHWFNPLAWLAYRFMCLDMEMCCDEQAVKNKNQTEKKQYLSTLLSLACEKQSSVFAPLFFSHPAGKKRILHILQYKKPQKITTAFICVLLVLFSACSVIQTKPEVVNLPSEQKNENQSFLGYLEVLSQPEGYSLVSYTDTGIITNTISLDSAVSDLKIVAKNTTAIRYDKTENKWLMATAPLTDNGQTIILCEFDALPNQEMIDNPENLVQTQIDLAAFSLTCHELINYQRFDAQTAYLAFRTKEKTQELEKLVLLKQENGRWTIVSDNLLDAQDRFKYGSIVFANKSVGFLSCRAPQSEQLWVKKTTDGGQNWSDIDFSEIGEHLQGLTIKNCCIEVRGSQVEIRCFVNGSAYENLVLFSEDLGETWDCYPREVGSSWFENQRFAGQSPFPQVIAQGVLSRDFVGEYPLHTGLDIVAPLNTEIYALEDGVVEQAVISAKDYGVFAVINHGEYSTLYAHCSALAVQQGDMVSKGQVIAYVGNSGSSTGPHLHFEVQKEGKCVNPYPYFESTVAST